MAVSVMQARQVTVVVPDGDLDASSWADGAARFSSGQRIRGSGPSCCSSAFVDQGRLRGAVSLLPFSVVLRGCRALWLIAVSEDGLPPSLGPPRPQ